MDMLLTVDEVLQMLTEYDFDAKHFHHTWKPNHSSFTGSNYQAIQDGMRNHHMNVLRWSDIGQHLTVFPDGMCMTGREWNRTPASISGQNTGAFAVEYVGNFDKGNDVFGGAQKETAIRLSKFFDDRRRPVIFHNEYSTKTCPGTSINKAEFMGEVREYGKEPSNEISQWAIPGRDWCISKGITDGTNPKGNLTREEFWTMLHRYHTR